MGGDLLALNLLQVEDEDIQHPTGSDLGVLLPERPGCGIPGIPGRGSVN